MARRLPRGRVTFAFVDVVESTKTFAEHGEAFVGALAVLQERVARHTHKADGSVVKTEGDGAFLAFPSARSAIDALVGLQQELEQVPVETVPRLRVRAGAHTGDAEPVGDDYVALAVNVAARVTSTVGAGQVVVSAATQTQLEAPVGTCVGCYDLKDVADPVELWRVWGDETPLKGSPSRRTNVRQPVTGFVGRAQELAELHELLDERRLVTVVGPGGLGKTRLVSELVLRIAAGIAGGAWLVELASLSTGDQVPGAVGDVLGLQAGDAVLITTELRRRGEVLLVLDNCEHLLDPVADLVVELAESCPELSVLCTSREPLRVPGEHVWRLGPIAGQAARIELFTQRAWASGVTVHDDSAPVVDRLCNALDGLPLAIELAATHAGFTSLDELVRIAEHGTDDLARRGGQPRQRSLDAVLSWSLDRLPAAHRASLLALSVFPGRFDEEMATTVLGAIEECETDAVRHLTRASLVDLDGETYRLLDTIKHAARRRLVAEPGLAAAARQGLLDWALAWSERDFRVARRWDDVPSDRALALEDALEHAVGDGVRGVGALWERARSIAYYREPSERVLRLARQVVAGRLPRDADEALCLASALSLLRTIGRPDLSDDRLEAMCEAADKHGVYFAAANLHYQMTFHHADHGDREAARRHVAGYLPYAESPLAHPIERRAIHTLRGVVATASGALEEALEHFRRALADARLGEGDVDLEVCEANVADALLELGRPAEALPHAVASVRLASAPGPSRRSLLATLARAQAELGETGAAAATMREIETELVASGRPADAVRAELAGLRSTLADLGVAVGAPAPGAPGPLS